MRRRKKLLRFVGPVAAATAAAAFPGCESTPKTRPPAPSVVTEPDPAGQTVGEAEQYARQLQAAMAARDPLPPAEVQWLTPGANVPWMSIEPVEQQAMPIPEVVVEAPEPAPEVAPVAEAPSPAPAPGTPMTRDELLRDLLTRIGEAPDADMSKAVDAALVSVLDPTRDLDRTLLEPLSYEQKDTIERYHHVMNVLAEQMKSVDSYFDRALLDCRLDELFGHMPIKIRHSELCRRVMGFGVYEPFESHTFLAGRDNKMIVYIELDQFRPSETDEEMYEVKLQQELALFNESDGLAVWRNEPVQIVDTSRNRRRDFFVVQLVTLPARLSVGKYRLKVRVTDMHGGSVDETSIPVEVVADEALVSR